MWRSWIQFFALHLKTKTDPEYCPHVSSLCSFISFTYFRTSFRFNLNVSTQSVLYLLLGSLAMAEESHKLSTQTQRPWYSSVSGVLRQFQSVSWYNFLRHLPSIHFRLNHLLIIVQYFVVYGNCNLFLLVEAIVPISNYKNNHAQEVHPTRITTHCLKEHHTAWVDQVDWNA